MKTFAVAHFLPSFLAASLLIAGAPARKALAQTTPAQDPPATQQDEAPPKTPPSTPQTPAETLKRSWQMLTDNVQDTKHFEAQTQALNALSSLGTNPRAVALIAAAMKDRNLDVRSAAVLAAGKTKSRALIEPTKKLLDDHEPTVVFIAAITLWKQFKDKSGEDILAAIAAGDRKANPSLIHGAEHDISRTIHSPSTLEKIGITTAAGLVLGPFGFSVGAIEYARKNGSDSSRVQSIELLAEDKTPGLHEQMKSSLEDKDPGVRAAAATAIGQFHRPSDAKAIEPLLDDSKQPVRLAAAAGYIGSLSGVSSSKAEAKPASKPAHK
jgi:HEAT repeat protein